MMVIFLTPCPPFGPSARFTSLIVYHLLLLAQSTIEPFRWIYLFSNRLSGDVRLKSPRLPSSYRAADYAAKWLAFHWRAAHWRFVSKELSDYEHLVPISDKVRPDALVRDELDSPTLIGLRFA
jgi:hypothetical protein